MENLLNDDNKPDQDVVLLKRFCFRKVDNTDSEFEIYYKIKCDKEAVAYSGFATPPDKDKFRQVFNRILSDSQQKLYYLCDVENANRVAATFHYKENDVETVEGLGYNVFPEYRGMGLGWLMMKKMNELCASQGYKYRLSRVSENNIASIKNLEKSGAYPTGEYEYRELPACNRKDKYLFYVTDLTNLK